MPLTVVKQKLLQNGTVIPAHPLALDENRRLDERRQRILTRYYLNAGVGGVAVGVHTTQFAIRDAKHDLYEPVLRIASEEVDLCCSSTNNTILKIAGVCGPTSQAVKEAELARKLGYDLVLLSPGGLSDYTEKDLLSRTKEVGKILPVFGFYLQPSVGGRLFTADYWNRFCEIESVAAIKTAPFNRYQTLDVIRAVALSDRADEISLYTGNDDNIIIDLLTSFQFNRDGKTIEKRFSGGLLGHWSVWTKTVCDLFPKIKAEAGQDHISSAMLTLAAAVTDCNAAFFDTANHFKGCIAGLHYVLRRQGLLENIFCLDEAEGLSPGQAEEIERVYLDYPFLSDDEFVKKHLAQWL